MSAKNLIKWLKKLKINKEKLPILLRIFEIIILFLVPIVFYIAWFISEYEEVHIFSNLEVIGNKLTFNNRQEMMALKVLLEKIKVQLAAGRSVPRLGSSGGRRRGTPATAPRSWRTRPRRTPPRGR